MTADISEEDLRGKFYIYGNLLSVKVRPLSAAHVTIPLIEFIGISFH